MERLSHEARFGDRHTGHRAGRVDTLQVLTSPLTRQSGAVPDVTNRRSKGCTNSSNRRPIGTGTSSLERGWNRGEGWIGGVRQKDALSIASIPPVFLQMHRTRWAVASHRH